MALQGQFERKNVILNGYHRVERVIDNPKKTPANAEVQLVSYTNSAKERVIHKTLFEVTGENYDNYFKDTAISPEGKHIQERAYSLIKTTYPNLVDV